MQRHLSVLGACLTLALSGGAGAAMADDLTNPIKSQASDQTQTADNAVSQSASSEALAVNVGPTVAVLNKGDVKQSSEADADSTASNQNSSAQTVVQSQESGQSQAADSHGCSCKSDEPASSQEQTGSNSIEQTADSKALAVNVGPNVAVLNKGDVKQSSEADADSTASNENSSTQTVVQGQKSGQAGGPVSQEQTGSNSIEQTADSKALAVNLGPNVAALNKGDVKQSSKADADSIASNQNGAHQTVRQQQESRRQEPTGCKHGRHHHGCQPKHAHGWHPEHECGYDHHHHHHGHTHAQQQESAQEQTAANSIEQSARSRAIALNASPNLAVLNLGDVDQSSGADADSAATNRSSSSQWIAQSQASSQRQSLVS